MKYLQPNKTYLFFSHTHKGQSYNMPMLKDIVNKVCNDMIWIQYEFCFFNTIL
jgi:hypothetical protein